MFQLYSPNMLKTYSQCPKKFHFRYIKNINMPVNEDVFEFGKNIHALASYYLKGQNIDAMESALDKKELPVWNYLKNIEYFSYEVINTEYSLSVKIDEKYFGGRLDALVRNNEILYILDYKTGSIPKNPAYDFQTIVYLLAVSDFFKTNNVIFVYIDLKNRKNVQINLTAEVKEEYKKILAETVQKLESCENFDKNNCEAEKKCEYSMICY